jgi:PAS domain S-box-containing protein
MQKSKIKILFVEDDETNSKLLADVLSKKFEHVTLARDGLEGLEKFKLDDFDIVLSDIEMPKMNGIEMIKEIKKINPTIFTILLTAYTETSYFIEAIHSKVDRFLTKPLDVRLLFTYIDNYEESLENKKLLIKQEKLLNHYKQVIDDILIVVKTDANGAIQYVNDKFCQTTGYTYEETIGKTHTELVSHHKLMDKGLFKDMWESITNLKPHQMVIRNQDKQGSSYWLRSYFYPIVDNNNNLIEIITFSENITDQIKKEKEAKLQDTKENRDNITKAIELSQGQFIKYIPFPTIIIDNQDLITEYNDEFETIILMSTDISLYEKLLEKDLKLSDIIKVDDGIFLLETLRDNIEIDGISQTFNLKYKTITQDTSIVSFINVQ